MPVNDTLFLYYCSKTIEANLFVTSEFLSFGNKKFTRLEDAYFNSCSKPCSQLDHNGAIV